MTDLRLYTVAEASEMTGGALTVSTLRALARKEKIGHIRGAKNQILFREAHLEAYLNEHTVAPRGRVPGSPRPTVAHPFKTSARSQALERRAS